MEGRNRIIVGHPEFEEKGGRGGVRAIGRAILISKMRERGRASSMKSSTSDKRHSIIKRYHTTALSFSLFPFPPPTTHTHTHTLTHTHTRTYFHLSHTHLQTPSFH